MKIPDALKMLIEAVNLAQSRGAYNLKEAATILQAVESFTNNTDNTMNTENMPDSNPDVTPGQTVTSQPEVTTAPEAPVENTVENGDSSIPVEPTEPAEVAETEPSL